ncbi:hypothetical protein KAK11_04250 [Ideonella paludis]|uniref:Uncharacterized protein n=3 Tax=Ideonella paludis TaxID=1233411 RepID=A0ABS5DTS6_9BURK|nr:hypothetical protein [Ideonella paludis]
MVMQRTPTKAAGHAHWWWGAAAAVAVGLALYAWAPDLAQAEAEPPPAGSAAAGGAGGPQFAAASAALQPPGAQPAPHDAGAAPHAAGPMVASAASSVTRRVKARPLALPEGAPTPWVLLGQDRVELLAQRPVEVAAGRTQPLLTLRDPVTGQVHYRLSVLRVELTPGADAASLAQALPGARLEFSNPGYALIEVVPEHMPAAFKQLQADARVLSVGLKAYTPPARPK